MLKIRPKLVMKIWL